MIKFKATIGDNKTLLGFGLSEENLTRLRNLEPIEFDLTEMGIDAQVLIFYGATEAAIAKNLAPLIGPDTKVRESDA